MADFTRLPLNSQEYADNAPNYRPGKDCSCTAASTSQGRWDGICSDVFGPEWRSHGGRYHKAECRGPFGCTDPGAPLCQKYKYTSDENDLVASNCCVFGNSQTPNASCSPGHKDSNGPKCHEIMKRYCSNESVFFTDKCQSWLQNPTNRDSDAIANRICPKYKNSSDDRQRKVCSCWNVEVPMEWRQDPEKYQALFGQMQCFDEECNLPLALKPKTRPACDINLTICTNEDIRTQLKDQGQITSVQIQNICGINDETNGGGSGGGGSGGGGSSSGGGGSKPPPSKDESSNEWYKNPLIWVVVGLVLLILLFLIL